MTFKLPDQNLPSREMVFETDNPRNPNSVFILCGTLAVELSRAAFMDAILEEARKYEFYQLTWMAKFGPSYERAA